MSPESRFLKRSILILYVAKLCCTCSEPHVAHVQSQKSPHPEKAEGQRNPKRNTAFCPRLRLASVARHAPRPASIHCSSRGPARAPAGVVLLRGTNCARAARVGQPRGCLDSAEEAVNLYESITRGQVWRDGLDWRSNFCRLCRTAEFQHTIGQLRSDSHGCLDPKHKMDL